MPQLFQDLRFGLKLLLRERAFTITALLTLAVCIGANVAIFSVINTVLLRPLPFEEADRLVSIYNLYPMAAQGGIGANASGDYFFRRERVDAFEDIGLFQGFGNTIGEPGETQRIRSLRITPSVLNVLRVSPEMGRGFTEEEMEPGNAQRAILTHGLWQDLYAGDPEVLGKEIRVDGTPFTIVGVLPAGFQFGGSSDFRLLLPTPMPEQARGINSLHSNNFQMLGRLKPGATIEQARDQIAALNDELTEQSPIPNAKQILADAGFRTDVVDYKSLMVRDIKPTLLMLWAGVLFVLLIGCVNIANLMLARANVRATELATRFAIGAGRGRLAAQLVTESVLLALLGGLLGLLIGYGGLKFLATLGADQLPRGAQIGMDTPTFLFAFLLSLVAGILFGLIPLMRLYRTDLSIVFRKDNRTGTASRSAMLVRNGLVVAQVSIAFVLLIGAGLMFMSFRRVLEVRPGFDPAPVLTGYVSLPGSRYGDSDERRLFIDRMLTEIRALPGVKAASVSNMVPFDGNGSSNVIMPVAYVPKQGESLLAPYTYVTGPGYFDAMGIPLLEGRTFRESDQPGDMQPLVIDEWLAERYWPDSSPIGKQMFTGVPGMEPDPESIYTIVGVVGHVKQTGLDEEQTYGAYYINYRDRVLGFMTVLVRGAVEPTSLTSGVRGVVTALDPDLPFFGVQTMEEKIDDSLLSRRASMTLLLIFAGVALFLAAVGIYGVLAYSVTQRLRELGIRAALGSSQSQLFGIILRQGLTVMGIGLVIGLGGALVLVRYIQSMLYGVAPADPLVLGAVALVLAVVSVLACVLPARQATLVDPVITLNVQ